MAWSSAWRRRSDVDIGFPPAYFLERPGGWFDRFAAVSVAAGTSTTVVSVRVPDRMVAIVLGIGIDSGQLTGWVWGSWTLRIAGLVDPEFQGVNGMIARALSPTPVYRRADPGTLIELVAQNTNAAQGFQYQGRLIGFFQDADKLYGSVSNEAADLRG